MEIYILKSAACLAILFPFYKLLLENTAMHSTKRVYLLASLVISLLIPFITFTQYIEVAPVTQFVSEGFIIPIEDTPIIKEPINYLPYILGSIYSLGVLFFGFRFGKNLYSLFLKVKRNPLFKEKSIWYVLLQLPVTPHSFFNYIFFDKKAYEAGEIPEEVMVHEQAHVTQKHSWDILFFEIFQIVFWFNPLLYFFKRSIKLNHEFLADRTVLQTGAELATYQNILLDFSSKSSVPAMAHSINYSSIKKRFNVMKTHTSRRAALLKGLLILPLLAVLIYGFSTTEVVEKPSQIQGDTEVSNLEEHHTARSISIKILDEGFMLVDGIKTPNKNLYNVLGSLNTDITKTQRDRIINIHVSAEGDIPYSNLLYIQKIASAYGYHRIVTPKEEIIRSKGNVPMALEATIKEISIFNRVAKKYNMQPIEARKITSEELIVLEQIYKKMSTEQKEKNQLFPECLPKNIPPTGKSYYDTLINGAESNSITSKNESQKNYGKPFILQIEISELRLNGVPVKLKNFAKTVDNYTKDWEETDYTETRPNVFIAATPKSFLDKVDAEFRKTHFSKANGGMNIVPPPPPLPPGAPKVKKGEASNIPPPPPPPSNMGAIKNKYKYSYVLYVNGESIYLNGTKVTLSGFSNAMDNHTKNWPARAYTFYGVSTKRENVSDAFINKLNREYRKTNLAKKSSSKRPVLFSTSDTELPPPPPPPPGPEKPLDHVIAMAKRNASFYYEKEPITSDKAIELIKKNPGLNIQSRLHDPNPPTVYISKKGITID